MRLLQGESNFLRVSRAPAKVKAQSYRTLDESKIIGTLTLLRDRIDEQFPGSGLAKVCRELIAVGSEVKQCADYLRSPNWLIRILAGLVIVGILLLILVGVPWQTVPHGPSFWSELKSLLASNNIQTIEAVINIVVFVGVTVLFVLNLETRQKRKRAHDVIHQLRSLAHVVDMHQLTKDPEYVHSMEASATSSAKPTMSPPALGRYLDYCSDLLSLTSKLSALLVQDFKDEVVLGEVNEIEALATGLSGKIWQKIQLLERAPERV